MHDDLPALDNDDFRRGQPTSHKVFGEAAALLAGDWLLAHACGLAAGAAGHGDELTGVLTEAVCAMIVGQSADLEGEKCPADRGLVRFIHMNKTAKLIQACCRMGSLCASADPPNVESLAGYGRRLGLAFQITDDLLDRRGSQQIVGKLVGKDAENSKQTYPAAFGVEESHQQARSEIEAAIDAVDSFGPAADNLRGLALYVLARDR
jgi:geranylgeranyl diphosphate synthase type II